MKKGPKNWFHGKGPFSKINKLTTWIRMSEAVHTFGLGGDALKMSMPTVDEIIEEELYEKIQNPNKL